MVFVVGLVLVVFFYFFYLITDLFTSSVWPYHFVCGVILLLVFVVFSCLLFGISFYVLSLGN